jgi:hypothetical protein
MGIQILSMGSHVVNMILVDCPNGNLVIGCLDAQSIPKWNVFKPEYWNYMFGLVDSFLENNGCIVFIQGADANSMGQVRACAKGSSRFELKKKFYCVNSIPLHTKTGKMINF